MYEPAVIAAAIVTVIVAGAAGIVSIINAKAAAEDRRDAKASRIRMEEASRINSAKTNTIIEKTAEIHTLANSNLSQVTSDLKIALTKIDGLEKLLASSKDRRS